MSYIDRSLFNNVRFYVLLFSVILSVGFYIYVRVTFPEPTLQIIRLTQYYALSALTFLYLAVLAGPLCFIAKWLPLRPQYLKSRRALGVSAFYFGILHGSLAFFGQLGGFEGLFFLSSSYLLSISLSFTALIILFLMAATSFDYMIAKLTFPKWKFLHRFVYLAIVLILIHALRLGSHFADLSEFIPQIFFIAFSFLSLLEANRFDFFLQKKLSNPEDPKPSSSFPRFGPIFIITLMIIVSFEVLSFFSTSSNEVLLSLGIHSQHIQLAQDAQNQAQATPDPATNNPALQGDRAKRYTVSFNHPGQVSANQDVPMSFEVFDASSGIKQQFFNKVYEKNMHLIVVDNSLKYFNHIHPELTVNGFDITTQFPHDGIYHLYLNFQPIGAIEQQMAFTLKVGEGVTVTSADDDLDTNLVKTFGDYQVKLNYPDPLEAEKLSVGQQTLTFKIYDAKSGQPVTTLKPYLAAFGHLVMINTKTYDYLHVHPANLVAPSPDANGGPEVKFLPLGLYGPIKSGNYRVFAQFNPDNHLFTSDFVITIK